MIAPDPRVPRSADLPAPLAVDPRRAVFAFDQAVDRLGQEAGFLTLGADRRAARYAADAHSVLDDVRTAMHRIEARADDPTLRKSARRRVHALAVGIAQAGLHDVERVARTLRRLGGPAEPGLGTALRVHAVRATAWGVEKWTGSPLAPAELRSIAAASQAVAAVEPIVRRGTVRRGARTRTWRRAGAITAAVGGGSLAVYGAWSLAAPLLGLG